jgi:hypothetical protein
VGSRLPHCRNVQWQGGFSRDLDPEPDRASDRLDWPAKSPGPEALEPEHTPEHAAADDDSEEGEPFLVSGGKGECGLFGPDKSPLIVQPIEETDDRGSVEARVPFRVLRREGDKADEIRESQNSTPHKRQYEAIAEGLQRTDLWLNCGQEETTHEQHGVLLGEHRTYQPGAQGAQ